jgi:small subunit ribosomal protein S14
MAKLSMIVKNNKRKVLINKYLEKKNQLKKEGKYLELDKLPKNASYIRYRNRCNVTGRPRGYMRFFGVSRICFREMASQGLIPGIVKASW